MLLRGRQTALECGIGFPSFLVSVLRKRPLYRCVPGFVGRDEGDWSNGYSNH